MNGLRPGFAPAAIALLFSSSMVVGQDITGHQRMTGSRASARNLQSVPGPHPSWALVMPGGGSAPLAALTLIRDSLIVALGATGIAPDGYPRPCSVLREPDQERPPGWFKVTCTDTVPGQELDGILLDPDNHYLALEVVNYPHARPFLLEVYLVPQLPYPPLGTGQRHLIPRVVVFHPHLSPEWHPAIWRAIEEGVTASGAVVLPQGGSGKMPRRGR